MQTALHQVINTLCHVAMEHTTTRTNQKIIILLRCAFSGFLATLNASQTLVDKRQDTPSGNGSSDERI